MKKMLPLLLLAVIGLCTENSHAQKQSPVQKLIAEALKPSPIQENLRVLTDEIGGRVPGSPAMESAILWGERNLRAAGADDVRIERFTMQHAWREGASRVRANADNETQFDLRAVSVGWGPPTLGTLHGPVVDVGEASQEELKKASAMEGAILLVHSETMKTWDDLFNEYLRAPVVIDAAVKGKAAGVLFISSRQRDLLYRHTNSNWADIDRLPMAIVAREDGERLARLVAANRRPEVSMTLPNVVGSSFETANVVAEIKGSEKPDEWVLIGAHLDSWELGTGALDNGCNAALVIDALRALKASGVKPKRSIRFALFSGEEEGLLGSRAYVEQHAKELDNAVGAIIFDEGTGRATGFSLSGRKDLVAPMSKLVAPFAAWKATTLTTDMVWGSDHDDFMLQGVPAFIANQQEGNYLENYHASSDTYDKVDFPELKRHVAMAAGLAFELADAPQRIGLRLNRAQLESAIKANKLDEQMKIFGVWQEWVDKKRGRTE